MNNEHRHTHGTAKEETRALLNYMANHNEHHTEELCEIADSLSSEAAKAVQEAVELLKQSTEKLRQAIGRLEE
ncbi:MAG: hypothetical protein IJU96_11180 [Clostridia bacterium]|nr:hypothetical protein [Clostridia bacterium]MBQ9553304.1 hypothetical protein [Clostridia bacterium]